MKTASSMTATPSSEEIEQLRRLVPLHTLPEGVLDELLESVEIQTVRKGAVLFEQGDTDHENVYLLDGRVTLLSDGAAVETVDAGSDTAKFPLAHQLPRTQTARAYNKVRIARIDSRRLSDMLARTRTVDYQVDDLDEASEDDWMSMLLQSRVLQQVPASNIQRVMMSVEQVEVSKGDDLIRQGDPGDFYYMLTRGRAVVRRDNGDGKGAVELATLGPGDAFGEEALLSDKPRNSSVAMLQDGEVLRLSKEHFLDLIQNPLLDRVDMAAAQAKVDQGALWLDLRSSEQYDESHLPGAINYPFESLRYQASSLAPDRHYVLYSNTGGRAMAGAFLLTERGFDVSVLQGGLHDEAIDSAVDAGGDAPVAAAVVAVADSAVEDETIQQRIREAEQRAQELEERLKAAQRDQEAVVAERQQQLQQVQVAVDQAKRKVLETEQQKREALEERQQAYAEMEQLTGNLERLENERASLVDRMSEIEGLDKQLQSRLAKAERELIGERERAESANSSLEELSERLSEVLEQREIEREQHARERGELKEDMTALQMELEQAQLDLEELQQTQRAQQDERSAGKDELEALQRRFTELEGQTQTLQQERDTLQETLERLQQDLAERERAAAEAGQGLGEQLDALQAERDGLQQQITAFEARATEQDARVAVLEQALADAEARGSEDGEARRQELKQAEEALCTATAARDELQRMLDDVRHESEHTVEALQGELDRLRADHEALQAELSSGNAEAGTAIEQAQARVAELEQRLAGAERQVVEEREAGEARLGALQASVDTLRSERDSDREALQQALDEAREAHRGLQDELTALQGDKAALQRQLDDGDRQTGEAVAEAEARAAALEQSLAEAQGATDELRGQQQQEAAERAVAEARLEEVRAELEAGLARAESEKQAAISALQADLEEARAAAAAAQERDDELERVCGEVETLRAQANETEQRLNAELEQLRRDNEALRADGAQGLAGAEQALEQLHGEKLELQQRLEERELALASARTEQGELIEALNAAGAERETLQLALSEKDDEQGRLVDLENQVAEAIRVHEAELLAHEQSQRELRDQLDAELARAQALQDELERVQAAGGGDADVRAERDALVAELAVRDSEVERLRGVIEEYVDQIRAAQDGDEVSEVVALRSELEMVREQALHDVAQMRDKLAAAETQKRRLQEADGREAISLESMRQRIEALESSLAERQRELVAAEDARHMLEDSLEDTNGQMDTLRRELETAREDANEAQMSRREAESAREQLQQALQELTDNGDPRPLADLRDERLAGGTRAIGLDGASAAGRWLGAGIGAGLVLLILEAVSLISGNGELISALLRVSGQ
jgi:CRP-like cAMP-binding protein/chromosome segregation ATPase